jgi:hypothetical protein
MIDEVIGKSGVILLTSILKCDVIHERVFLCAEKTSVLIKMFLRSVYDSEKVMIYSLFHQNVTM